jgi:soluble lytic murein transglycosylase-like protein
MAGRLLLESRRENIPPAVALAIVEQESSFNPEALNRQTDDYGLFQVHFPFWKRYFARRSSGTLVPLRPEELFEMNVNIRVGLLILRHDIDLEGGNIARGIGRYSGRKGEKKMNYEQQVVANEVRFLAYYISQVRTP